ncbi:MAG: phosphotransferase [Candidatus Marsarchaeota archaeon]|nr:phosphotransferase [Candidatus Marsarchaeota archaeon]
MNDLTPEKHGGETTYTEDELNRFLVSQRWFGGKGRRISHIQVVDELGSPMHGRYSIQVLNVAYGDGNEEYYLLTLLRPDNPEGGNALAEATDEPVFQSEIFECFAKHSPIRLNRGELSFQAENGVSTRRLKPRKLRGEQSNTTIFYGTSYVLKLYRKLSDWPSPEIEMLEFLSKSKRAPSVPGLVGWIRYDPSAAKATPKSAGLLTTYVKNRGDCWSYVVGEVKKAAASNAIQDTLSILSAKLEALGEYTAKLHVALASDSHNPEFTPEPVTEADTRRWISEMSDIKNAMIGELDKSEQPTTVMKPLVKLDEGRFHQNLSWLVKERVSKIRIHGDYHLGQVLVTGKGFTAFDFEGEPARPISYRRSKFCALKDLAGMVRSIQYAASYCSRLWPEYREKLGEWAAASIGLFQEGYRRSLKSSTVKIAPSGREGFYEAAEFFVFEKALYELQYEINNRPDWVGIPLEFIRSHI